MRLARYSMSTFNLELDRRARSDAYGQRLPQGCANLGSILRIASCLSMAELVRFISDRIRRSEIFRLRVQRDVQAGDRSTAEGPCLHLREHSVEEFRLGSPSLVV
jgi:hypothetical protein